MPDGRQPQRRPRGALKRSLWLAALCVLLGLVTSVGVAWGWAPPEFWRWYWGGPDDRVVGPPIAGSPGGSIALLFASDRIWVASRLQFMAVDQSPTNSRPTPVPTNAADFDRKASNPACQEALRRHEPLLRTPDAQCVEFTVTLVGWPIRCLAYESAATRKQVQSFKGNRFAELGQRTVPFSSIPVDPAFDGILPHYNALEVGDHLLPTFPLWPGLLADTAFYAGAWGVLIFGPLFVRRRLRRRLRARRGACVRCGYSREGLSEGATCPECGQGA